MAVVARHLDAGVVWSDQIGLQVRVVIQFEAARVPGIATGGSKVRMLFLKAGDGRVKSGRAIFGAQVGVAPGTRSGGGRAQAKRSLVLDVA